MIVHLAQAQEKQIAQTAQAQERKNVLTALEEAIIGAITIVHHIALHHHTGTVDTAITQMQTIMINKKFSLQLTSVNCRLFHELA